MSQAELASAAGIPASQLSMIETGTVIPDAAVAEALAAALKSTPAYLGADLAELEATRPLLRAYADAPKRNVDMLVEDTVTALEAASILRLRAVIDELPVFVGDANDDEAIEQFALEVRAQAGLSADAPVGNAIRAAERLGCVVLPLDSELGRHLGMSFRVGERPVIRVSRPSGDARHTVPGDRQRFTVAHELGHLTLHRFTPPPASPLESARIEREAHRFAGAFLAPGDAVQDSIAMHGGRVTLTTLAALKERWGISIKALVVRVRQLGIIDEEHARSLYKQISARKWNKNEPVHVDTEAAVWWTKALATRFPSGDAQRQAAHEVGLDISYFGAWTDWSPAPRSDGAIDLEHERVRRAVDPTGHRTR